MKCGGVVGGAVGFSMLMLLHSWGVQYKKGRMVGDYSGFIMVIGAVVKQSIDDVSIHEKHKKRPGSVCYKRHCVHDQGGAKYFLFNRGNLEEYFKSYGLDIDASYIRMNAKKIIRERRRVDWERPEVLATVGMTNDS